MPTRPKHRPVIHLEVDEKSTDCVREYVTDIAELDGSAVLYIARHQLLPGARTLPCQDLLNDR
jgi:hypothetical protein